jgi:HK97 family phage portal protein
MSVLNFFAGSFGPSQPVSAADHWLVRLIGGASKASVPVNEYLALNLPVVYACVTLLADTIGVLPCYVEEVTRDPKGKRKVKRLDDHPISYLLANPNKYMSQFIFTKTTQGHEDLWGNSIIEIEQNGKGEAIALWPTEPGAVWPDAYDIRERGPKNGILRYRGSVNGEDFNKPYDEVLHFRAFGLNGYLGLSPIHVARNAIGLGLATEEFGSKFFANDAKSGGFLQHPGALSEKAQTNLKDSMGPAGQGGLKNAHAVKILEEGMKFVSTTIPPEDAQFLGTREFQIAEMARIYRIPLVLLQSHEKTTSWGSGIEHLTIGFVRWSIQPRVTQREQELTNKLLSEADRKKGLRVRVDVNVLLRADMSGRAAWYESLSKIGALTPDEIREEEGRAPLSEDEKKGFALLAGNAAPAQPNKEPNEPETESEQ